MGQDEADDTGNAFRELRSVKLFPCVGMKKLPQVHLTANFGQQPFVFDIDGMVKVCMFRRHLKPADPRRKRSLLFTPRSTPQARRIYNRRWMRAPSFKNLLRSFSPMTGMSRLRGRSPRRSRPNRRRWRMAESRSSTRWRKTLKQ